MFLVIRLFKEDTNEVVRAIFLPIDEDIYFNVETLEIDEEYLEDLALSYAEMCEHYGDLEWEVVENCM